MMRTRAPGRICLFGDHQDYLGLPVIACAIDRFITVEGNLNQHDQLHIELPDLGTSPNIKLHQEAVKPGDHLQSAVNVLLNKGYSINQGAEVSIQGNVPINAGLSSSSAMTVAWVHWLLKAYDDADAWSPEQIAELAYQAEVVEQQASGGRMDQYTSAYGGVVYIETEKQGAITELTSLQKHMIDTQVALIIGVSGIPKQTDALLKKIKDQALEAVAIVKKAFPKFDLKAALVHEYDQYQTLLPASLKSIFYAALKNHQLTQQAAQELRKDAPDLTRLGGLMNEHHQVLRDNLKITVPRIDAMIEAALNTGALGAKIVGSGGGGSICAWVAQENQQAIEKALIKAGAVEVAAVQISPGTLEL
ncbi:mevalonate kinase family protein [Croceiramulus getboli]|nr:galactokinase family protein [Flavobacteriaceae bacterium YJPT1-3]